ncbi:MAG TPA: proton-conducting transporter membrane subunit, partial [Desulfuromonadaceae bacterium]
RHGQGDRSGPRERAMTGPPEAVSPVVLVGIAVMLASLAGLPGLFIRDLARGQRIATFFILIASLTGLSGAGIAIATGRPEAFTIDWSLPFGPGEIGIDRLSALFLLPIFIISSCCALYATEYWPAAANPRSARKLSFFFGILTGALAMLVIARESTLFLMAWEVMALSCYFVLTADDGNPEVREAGELYMITTHIGTLALFALFALLRSASGFSRFPAAGALDGGSAMAAGIFVAAFLGFGLKAGLMPLHIWLPSAHANAPSHISALMSGVLIKMGIYGLIRTYSFFDHLPLWWGASVLSVGALSGILGVAFAIAQHDLKRLLAYHSIENIGIIAIGIGVALIGRAIGSPLLTVLGMAGALLHVLNHATFKALLFLCAGAVIHGLRTREIDLMGGVARRAPWTAFFFLVGAVAICGLPPLNGFVSEFLIYLGLFNGVRVAGGTAVSFLALAAPSLALIGGLAVACFVKVYGAVFLGLPRTSSAADVHEVGWSMRAPMGLLALICALVGLFPPAVTGLLEGAVSTWQPALSRGEEPLSAVAPLWWLTILGLALLCVILLTAVYFARRLASSPQSAGLTWDCGYLRPSPRMQYSASSFAEMLVKLFGGVLRPHWKRPAIAGPFPQSGQFASHVPEAVLELVFLPFLERANTRLGAIRRLQHGQLHLYIFYNFVTLILLLIWARYS